MSHHQPKESHSHLQSQDLQNHGFQELDLKEQKIQESESSLVADLKAQLQTLQANNQIDLLLLKAQEDELVQYRRQIHALGLELESWKDTVRRLNAGLEKFLLEDMAR